MFGRINQYKILSLGFSYPEEENWAVIDKLLTMPDDLFEEDVRSGVADFRECFCKNRKRIVEIQSEYLAIFDVGRKISPYQTEYTAEKVSRKSFELADISGFYSAFGLNLKEEMQYKEALDHISIELEFMAILEWKEQFALENGLKEKADIVGNAKFKFLNDHLAGWGYFFCHQIYGLGGDGFFIRLAGLLESVLVSGCREYSIDVSIFDKPISREPYCGVRSEELTC